MKWTIHADDFTYTTADKGREIPWILREKWGLSTELSLCFLGSRKNHSMKKKLENNVKPRDEMHLKTPWLSREDNPLKISWIFLVHLVITRWTHQIAMRP